MVKAREFLELVQPHFSRLSEYSVYVVFVWPVRMELFENWRVHTPSRRMDFIVWTVLAVERANELLRVVLILRE